MDLEKKKWLNKGERLEFGVNISAFSIKLYLKVTKLLLRKIFFHERSMGLLY